MRWREILQWTFNVLVLAALAGALAGVVYLFSVAIEQGATIVAAFLAAFATVAGAVLVRYFERRRHMEATRREHLGALYVQLGSALAGHDIPDRMSQARFDGDPETRIPTWKKGTPKPCHDRRNTPMSCSIAAPGWSPTPA
ncbi:MAG TPA: hypothetical protein VGH58_05170, partial [Solirubrobacterales bacterium]